MFPCGACKDVKQLLLLLRLRIRGLQLLYPSHILACDALFIYFLFHTSLPEEESSFRDDLVGDSGLAITGPPYFTTRSLPDRKWIG